MTKKKCVTSILKNFIIVLMSFAVTVMTLWAENPSILLNGSFENYSTLDVDVFPGLQLHAGMKEGRYAHDCSWEGNCGLCVSYDDPFLNAMTMSSSTVEATLMPVTTESEVVQLSAEIVNGGVSIPPSGDAVSSMGTEYFELDARAFTCLPTNCSPLRSTPLGTIISVR